MSTRAMPERAGERKAVSSDGFNLPLATAVFCLLTVAILVLGWRTIQGTSIEGYDPATNSTLIQSAKHFRLAVGNYSRIGFNHPGPAILYVLAAGEALFYDVLRVVPSPVAGQMVAVAAYSAFWSALVALTFSRIGLTRTQAVLALFCLLAFVSSQQPTTFDELWFPRLYTMPFACFTVALAGILAGHRPSWVTAALAFGFLENGHVSFLGICAVMGATAALWNLIDALSRGSVVASFGRPDRWVGGGAVTALFFLLPLAWREVRHHPGPIEQYAAFAHANAGHGIAAAGGFIAAQLGATNLAQAVALAGAFVLVALSASLEARCVIGALAAALVGTLYYAAFGVDDLAMSYTVLFFAAVPGIAVGAALSLLAAAMSPMWTGRALAGFCALIAAVIWGGQVASVGRVGAYDVPEIADLDRAIRDQGPAPIALDLDTSPSGNFTTWTMMVGVQALELRRDGHLSFCIRQGWHIAFTEAARCPDDGRGLKHVRVGPASEAPADAAGGAGLAVVPQDD